MSSILDLSKPKTVTPNTYVVVCIFMILWAMGLMNLYSASGGGGPFWAQMKHLVLGCGAFWLFGWGISIKQMNTYSYLAFAALLGALVIVAVLGHTAGGAQRWLNLGIIRFQPSEAAKLSTAMMVAKFFYNNRNKWEYELWELWPVLFMAFLTFVVIFEQPDFGTAGFCLLVVAAQLAFVRINISRGMVGALCASAMGVLIIGWNFLMRPYQKLRVLNLLDPHLDPSGSGYNALQSLVAVGSGGLFGKGFLQGTQAQLQFLPARHTDFIFSVFAEEHGFWGGIAVFILFGALAYIALDLAREARDSYTGLLAVGIMAIIFIEFTINVAMVLGMFPVVGIPLPFFSHGGTSLLTICSCMGLLVGIDRDNIKSSSHRVSL